MTLIEKKDFIHSHLHFLDDMAPEESYVKMQTLFVENSVTGGYDVNSEERLTKKSMRTELFRRNNKMEIGSFLSLEQVEELSKKW